MSGIRSGETKREKEKIERERKGNILSLRRTREILSWVGFGGGEERREGDGKGRCGKRAEIGGGLRGGERRGGRVPPWNTLTAGRRGI